MGFIVGMVICYQVLFADISDRLAEFATLKAMGYSDRRLFRIVVEQAVYLALLGLRRRAWASAWCCSRGSTGRPACRWSSSPATAVGDPRA